MQFELQMQLHICKQMQSSKTHTHCDAVMHTNIGSGIRVGSGIHQHLHAICATVHCGQNQPRLTELRVHQRMHIRSKHVIVKQQALATLFVNDIIL